MGEREIGFLSQIIIFENNRKIIESSLTDKNGEEALGILIGTYTELNGLDEEDILAARSAFRKAKTVEQIGEALNKYARRRYRN